MRDGGAGRARAGAEEGPARSGGTMAHSPLGSVVLGRAAILAPPPHSLSGRFLAAILGWAGEGAKSSFTGVGWGCRGLRFWV